MGAQDIEIVIARSGEVQVHVKGVKGKGCLEWGRLLAAAVGRVKHQQLTSEYYEPDTRVRHHLGQAQAVRSLDDNSAR
jgi:hypothetical protein